MTFTKRYRYRFGDIDHAGIAYYPSLLHYFHCCFEDWWSEAMGVHYAKVLDEERYGLPAVHIEADFFRPIRFGDEPDISIAVLDMGTSSVEFGFWMQVGEVVACRARITTVSVDMATLNKQPIPERWRHRFEEHRIDPADLPRGR